VPVANSAAAAWPSITNMAVLAAGTNDYVTNAIGNLFVPKTPEVFGYDLDGNMTNDGRWAMTWDGENRLIAMESLPNAPIGSSNRLFFAYDQQSRRVSKAVQTFTGGAWTITLSNRFVYDGWNLLAELNATNNAVINAMMWGLDLSGSLQGAGGVGGLLGINVTNAGAQFVASDGNGNDVLLLTAISGLSSANYEYDPFGHNLRATGPMALLNPFRFSTKYTDGESGFNYYGYRFYNAKLGRWISRDPMGNLKRSLHPRKWLGEQANLYRSVRNDSQNSHDLLGLAVNQVQVATFCPTRCGPDYTQAINAEIADFRSYLDAAPEGLPTIQLLNWFKNVLGSLDYAAQANKTGSPADCQGTITLCGRCVGSDAPGNIMFGFAVAAIGIPQMIAAAGADYAEATDGDGEGDVGAIGAVIYAALGIPIDEDHDVFPLGQQLYNSGSDDICSVVKNLPAHAASSCTPNTKTIGAYKTTTPFRRFNYPRGW
jgi:RHS repeat-associated protein